MHDMDLALVRFCTPFSPCTDMLKLFFTACLLPAFLRFADMTLSPYDALASVFALGSLRNECCLLSYLFHFAGHCRDICLVGHVFVSAFSFKDHCFDFFVVRLEFVFTFSFKGHCCDCCVVRHVFVLFFSSTITNAECN